MACTKFKVNFHGDEFTFEFEGEPTWYEVDNKTVANKDNTKFLEIKVNGDIWAILHEPTSEGVKVIDKTTEGRLMLEDGSNVNDLDSPEHGATYIIEGELQ